MKQAPQNNGFNLSAWALDHAPLTRYLMVVLMVLGIAAYFQLGQDEDPPFTFRAMVVRTYWPGATAAAGGRAGDRQDRAHAAGGAAAPTRSAAIPSRVSRRSFSRSRTQLAPNEVANVWYTVRKKVGDMRGTLPQGVQGPFFNDDFGDVFGVIYALESDGFSYAEVKHLPTTCARSCCACPMWPRSSCLACRTKSCISKSRKSACPNWGWT